MSTPKLYAPNDLFRPGNNTALNACVGTNGGPYEADAYALGYFEAGIILVHGAANDHGHVDLLVYPITYCYRHAVELGLKFLAERLPPLVGGSAQVHPTHRLLDNWAEVHPFLRQDPRFDLDGTTISTVQAVLNDIVQVDPIGEVFRFPTTRAGDHHIPTFEIINVAVLAVEMEKVQIIFKEWFRIVHTFHE